MTGQAATPADVRRNVLLDSLRVAVALEMAKVTDASMDLFLIDRDRWTSCMGRAAILGQQVKEIYANASTGDSSEAKLGEAERAEVDRLNAEIKQLHDHAENETLLGLIASKGDDLMYGGRYCAKAFNALAYSLAHMAHADGGVAFAGLHWCRSGHNGTSHVYPCDAELARTGQAVA